VSATAWAPVRPRLCARMRTEAAANKPSKGAFAAHCCPCVPDSLCSLCRRLQGLGGCGTMSPSSAGCEEPCLLPARCRAGCRSRGRLPLPRRRGPANGQAPALRLILLNYLGLLVPFRRLISLLEAVKPKPPNSNNMTTKDF